jgi:transcriptional regulator with XRE-family HTH domain
MIGEIIRKARTSKKMTTTQLADNAGVTQSMVSRYESGRVIPTKAVLKRIFKVLELDYKKMEISVDADSNFDQREFDSKLAKAKSLSIKEKEAILIMVNSFLKNKEAEILVSNWNSKN